LQNRLGTIFEVQLPLRILLRSPSPVALAEAIEAELGGADPAEQRARAFLAGGSAEHSPS
jgi:hypothetical protein